MTQGPDRQDMPGVRQQWLRLPRIAQVASLAVPVAVIVLSFLIDVRAGASLAVLIVGMGAATVVYVKNRTDRLNAAARAQRERRTPPL